jgi:hypothetical protein
VLGTYGAVLLLLVAAAVVGVAVALLCGLRARLSLAPVLGFALLIAVADVFSALPGRATTGFVALVLLVLAAAAVLVTRRRDLPPVRLLPAVLVPLSALLATAIPFAARERMGLLGVGMNNDTAAHLFIAEGVRSAFMERLIGFPDGYPIGPQSLTAVVSSGIGATADAVLVAILIAATVLTVVTAYAVAAPLGRWRRGLAALLSGCAYLAVAYYGQGAFKETILALFLLGAVGVLKELRRGAPPAGAGPALAVLVAGTVFVYSYQGIAWFAALLGILAVLWLAERRLDGLPLVGADRRGWLRGLALGIGVLAVLLVFEAGHVLAFLSANGASAAGSGQIAADDLGNLPGPLSFFEALGLWNSDDFRIPPADRSFADLLSVVAVVALLAGAARALQRRNLALLAGLLAAGAVYALSRGTGQSPYVDAKALMVLAPLASLTVLVGLLDLPRPALPRVLVALLAALFAVLGARSSLAALRTAPVGPTDQLEQLHDLAGTAKGSRTLFLDYDDYAIYALRGVEIGYLPAGYTAPVPVPVRPEKPWTPGNPVDWDDVAAADQDRFRYAIIPRSAYASQPPPNWRFVRATALFALYERTGPTAPRDTIEGPEGPGRILDCTVEPGGRALRREAGTARVQDPPVALGGIVPLPRGQALRGQVDLPAGRWSVSVQYTGGEELQLTVGGERFRLPANQGRPGAFFRAGELETDGGPLPFEVRAIQANRLAPPAEGVVVQQVVLSRPDSVRDVPLRRICGKWVDFYAKAG